MTPPPSAEDLTPRAVERLLELAAPLGARPEGGAIDLERYELGPELGRGGMGVVYAARDRQLDRRVALKVLAGTAGLAPAARERFAREAKAAARLSHPHVARVYDATPDAIAMQLVEGPTLAEAHGLDPRELAGVVRDAALAVHYAHGEGVVHRDLKPANLMLEREASGRWHVYVLDFGLAKELDVDASRTGSGVVGTPAFMAPEQAAGRTAEVGPRTDVHGLGATLYAALAGRPPFAHPERGARGDVVALLRRVVEVEAPPLRGVDRDLATIVAKCLEKEPARRYPTALALASDLDRWLRGEPVQARPASLGYRLRRFVSRRQGALAAAGAAAVLVALAVLPFVLQARARRTAAEEQRELAERVLGLSLRVEGALRDARATREAGVGHERDAVPILAAAAAECRAFLEEADVGHVHVFLGRLHAAQGLSAEALAAFDRAAALRPEIPELRLERGLVLAALYRDGLPLLGGDAPAELDEWRARAVADLEAALGAESGNPTVDEVFARGQLAWVSGDRAGAIETLREAVEMDLAHHQAHLSLARLYVLEDRVDLAMRHSVVASDLLRGYRPSYVASANVRSSAGEPILPDRELLPLEGMRELCVDFSLLLQLAPGDANTWGLRAQVQLRRGLRALAKDARLEARQSLELAVRELTATLTLEPDHVPALVNRGVARARLARLYAGAAESGAAAEALAAGLADYDAAVAAEPSLAVARFDRALLHAYRASLARLGRRPAEARAALEAARADAGGALAALAPDHPWRWRFQALFEELD